MVGQITPGARPPGHPRPIHHSMCPAHGTTMVHSGPTCSVPGTATVIENNRVSASQQQGGHIRVDHTADIDHASTLDSHPHG